MLISGERGKKGIGFSLKDSNNTGTYNIYIWNKNDYDAQEVKERRDMNKKKNKKRENYSKVGGWQKIGRYDDFENRSFYIEQIIKHIKSIYNEDITAEQIEEKLLQRFNELEDKRKKKLAFIRGKIKYECIKRGITKIPEINTVKAGKYHLKRITEQTPEKK